MDWDKRENETVKAFAAFVFYRDLGPARSLDKAYRTCHPDRPDAAANGSWNAWCRENDWIARAGAWDLHCEQQEREEFEAELRRVARGRGRIDSTAQELLEESLGFARTKLEFFRTLTPEALPLDDISRLVRLLAGAVRAGGSGISNNGPTQPAQTIVREYVGVDVDAV